MGRKSFAILSFVAALSTLTGADAVSFLRDASSPAQGTPKATTGVSAPGASSCTPSPEEGPWKAASELFRLQSNQEQPQASDAEKCEIQRGQVSWLCTPDAASIEFMIAAVADPSQTHLALDTDRGLESLMWAVGDAGYTFERYWLPWTGVPEKEGSSVADQQCRARLREYREAEPGLLIFRRYPPNAHQVGGKEFLFVFVAGETPTSGINKSALSKAVRYIRQISGQAMEIRLLGPNFSGSLRPLNTDLHALYQEDNSLSFHIVSGTATNWDAISEFEAGLTKNSHYESAVDNDLRASKLFFLYVGSQWRPEWFSWLSQPREIAILSEDETVYGSGDIRTSLNDSADPRDLSHDWLMLRFPREISRLRNVYSEETATVTSKPKEEVPAQNGVPLTLRDSASGGEADLHTDSIATFSEQQSPASQQATLLTIASTLRRERAAYAGIVATDVLDSLFLSRFLRLSDPDVRIFTLDADLLFLREAETAPMIGLLAVTNYPLFSRNQHWTELEVKGQMPRRIQFSSRFSEGVYNACRRLIPPVELNSSVERYLEYERPFDERRDGPPVWLTVLGRDGYWPLALLDETKVVADKWMTLTLFDKLDAQHERGHTREPLHPEPPSRGWGLFLLLACVFCFLHGAYVAYLLTRPKEKAADYVPSMPARALQHLFAAYPARRPSEFERPFLLTATISLFSALLVFSLPLSRFLSFNWARTYFLLACLSLLGLLILAVWLTIGKPKYPRVTVISWLVAISFLTIWSYLILRGQYHAGIFMAYRALYLGNGVSPGIPIVLLATAFYGWAWVHLKQESASIGRRAARSSNEFRYLPEFQSLMFNTDNAIEDIMAYGISVPALISVVGWFLIMWPVNSVRTFESYWYDILYIFVLTVLYWCIALVWVQFIRCWRRFRELLQALERHPIRKAFSRLPKEISWIPLVSTSPSKNLFLSSRTCECLRAILTSLEKIEPRPDACVTTLTPCWCQATDALDKLEMNIKKGEDLNAEVYRSLQLAFDEAAHCIVGHLRSSRWSEGESESLAQAEKELQALRRELTPEEKLTVLEEEFVALRVLMFLRYVIRQLRNWLGFIVGGFIISIVSLNSYPFQAHRWIGVASMIMLIAIGSGVAFVFAEMDKDAILSRITDTKSNAVGKTFFFRLARFGTLPLLTVLGAQFPAVSRYLFSWVQPALEALK